MLWDRRGGAATTFLLASNLPAHTHSFAQPVSSGLADQTDPTGAYPAMVNEASGRTPTVFPAYTKVAATGTLTSGNTGVSGGSTAFSTQSPFLAINYCIALQGIFPRETDRTYGLERHSPPSGPSARTIKYL